MACRIIVLANTPSSRDNSARLGRQNRTARGGNGLTDQREALAGCSLPTLTKIIGMFGLEGLRRVCI
jgi:hypothetical protein